MTSVRALAFGGAILFALTLATEANKKKPAHKTADPKTVAAYKKLGGTYGALQRIELGTNFVPGSDAAELDLPAFLFPGGPPSQLPDADVPFGLHLGYYAMNRPMVGWLPENIGSAAPMSDDTVKHLRGLKNLQHLYLYSFGLTNAGMKELGNLPNLTRLDLTVPLRVSDEGIKELARLENLTELGLLANDVTDAGMKDLAKIKKLSVLFLLVTKLSDAGLKDLAAAPNLRTLCLLHAQGVTDAGMKELARMKDLTELHLSYINISNAGLKDLAPLRKLTVLSLDSTKITNAGLKDLEPFERLTSLDLSFTAVSDAGLPALAALPRLETLRLFNTAVTAEGIGRLQKQLPRCKISR